MGTLVKDTPPRFVHMDVFVRYAWDFLQPKLLESKCETQYGGDTVGEFWIGSDCVNFLFRGELIAMLEMVVNSEIGAAIRCLGPRKAPVPEEWSVDEAQRILFGFKGEYPFDSALKPRVAYITEWLEQVKQASTSGPSVLDGKYPDKYCEILIQPRVYLGHGYLDRAKLFAKIYALPQTGRVVIHFSRDDLELAFIDAHRQVMDEVKNAWTELTCRPDCVRVYAVGIAVEEPKSEEKPNGK